MRLLVLALLLAPSLTLLIPTAEAVGSESAACARMEHRLTGRNTYRVSSDTQGALESCPTDGGFNLAQSQCVTLNNRYDHQTTQPAPSEPSRIIVYAFHGDQLNDHGSGGDDNWAGDGFVKVSSYSLNFFPGSTFDLCATHDGTPSGQPLAGKFRIVIRACLETPPNQFCDGPGESYDINSDENPTCSCSGNPGTAQTVTGVVRGVVTGIHNDELGDPISVWAPDVKVNTPQNISVHLSFDNMTARTGAGGNVSLWVQAPDGSWAVNGAQPTETLIGSGNAVRGYYHYTFTPTQVGRYIVFANHTTSLNEIRSSKPWGFRSLEYTESDVYGFLTYLSGRVNATTSPLATTAHVENVNGYVSGRINATTAPLATTEHLGNTNGYLAGLANSTTAPLARTAHVENVNGYLAGLINASGGGGGGGASTQHLENVNAYLAGRINLTGEQVWTHAPNRTLTSGANLTFGNQVVNLNGTTADELTAMSAFFTTPFVSAFPFFAGAVILALLTRRVTGIMPNVVLLIVTLGATFAITTSKEELDATDPLFSPILIVLYLALVLFQVYRWASGGINETHS